MNFGLEDQESEPHLLKVIISLQGQELQCDVNKNKSRNINEYMKIDTEINQQITENHSALKKIPEVYSTVLDKIKFAQSKIKSCKEKIDGCKTSLQCQRDDLKRLYLDSVTNGEILKLIDNIDKVREVSGTLDNYMKNKHYQHATRVLKKNVASLEGDLSGVEALKDIKQDLKTRKDELHLYLIEQLQNHLYLKAPSAKEKVQLFRSGEPPPMDNEEDYEDEEEDLTKDPEEDSYKFLKLLIQSLQQLDKLEHTIEVIEKNMEKELKNILINTAQDLLYKKRLTNQIDNEPALFKELLEECFAKYRAIAASHHVVINAIEHLMYNRQTSRYTINIVWSKIQTSVEMLLKDYLAVNTSPTTQSPVTAAPITYATSTADMSQFFARAARRPDRFVKGNLFSFESSLTGMMISSECHIQQYNKNNTQSTQELPTLCHKTPHNIELVFKLITNFIKEINNVINMTGNQQIPLQIFLNDFVDDSFIPTLERKVKRDIADATEGNSGLSVEKLHSNKSGCSWPRPLLQGTIRVQKQLVELRALMNRMPKYCSKFLDIIINLLKKYKDICQNTFKNMVKMDEVNEMVCHVWFKDQKITQIIRQLPMWKDMFPGGISEHGVTHGDLLAAINTHRGKDLLPKDRVISEPERLLQLAQLHDSTMWLVNCVDNFVENLQHDKEVYEQLSGTNVLKSLAHYKTQLSEICAEFVQLAEDCLLILFLEIRVQCFYHLLIVLRKQDYKVDVVSSDPDNGVTLLNKSLSQLEEKIREYLPATHTKFLFDGLGYIMSGIIIGSAGFITEISIGGLKKMSRNILALQQNLTNITLTCELDLERTRFYYELLYQKPDEILRNIVEKQKRFTKSEYVELIQLYYRSNKKNIKRYEKLLNQHLVKLNEIMETAGESDAVSR